MSFFEIDHPASAYLKAKGIEAMGQRENLRLIPEDLGERKLVNVLKANESWDPTAQSVIIADRDEVVSDLLRRLHHKPDQLIDWLP